MKAYGYRLKSFSVDDISKALREIYKHSPHMKDGRELSKRITDIQCCSSFIKDNIVYWRTDRCHLYRYIDSADVFIINDENNTISIGEL